LGLGEQDAAGMSTSLVGLAADLASFNNANPEDVLLALRSGLSGEIEPMKKFGVAMNETIMKAKAMELGFGDNIQALTEAEKLQVRYAIILQQTTTAQGDFARTSDGLANSTRIAKAQFTDMAATLGTQLLPIALKVMQFLSDLIDKFNNLTPAQQKTVLVVAAIVAAIGPAITIIGGLISAIGAIIPVVGAVAGVLTFPLIAIIAAVIAVIALLYAAWTNNWGGIQEKVAAFIAWIKPVWEALWAGITAVFNFVWEQIKTIWAAFQAAFSGDWYTFGEKLREVWNNIWQAIGNFLSTAWENLIKPALVNLIVSVIRIFTETDWGEVGMNIIRGIADGITAGVSWIVNAAQSAAQAAIDAAKGFLGIADGAANVPERTRARQGYASGTGGWLTVPSGFSNDTYPVGLSSGEQYAVIPAGQSVSPAGAGTEALFGVLINELRANRFDSKQISRDIVMAMQKGQDR